MNCTAPRCKRPFILLRHLGLLTLGFMAGEALAAPPAAPTNLQSLSSTVADATTQVFRFDWTDNATDEDGFFFYARYGGVGGPTQILSFVPVSSGIRTSTGPLSFNLPVATNTFGNGWVVDMWVVAYKGDPVNNLAGVEQSAGSNFDRRTWLNPLSPTLTAPSNLVVTPSGDGSFQLSFSDNSTGERYFQVDYKKTADSTWIPSSLEFNVASAELGGYAAAINIPNFQPSTSYDFQVRAVSWSNPATASAYTPVVSATTNAFAAPTNLTATLTGEASYQLAFTNNSTAESGYEFQFRAVGSTTWTVLGRVDDPFFISINSGTLNPGTNYEFQVRAYIRDSNLSTDEPVLFSDFSNVAVGTGAAVINAPTNLAGSSPGEGLVNLTWTDNSSIEGNYEVQVREKGATQWAVWDYYGENSSGITNELILPGAVLEFRVRATRGGQAQFQSAFTDIVEVTVPFAAPTGLTATPGTGTASETEVTLDWNESSTIEDGYAILVREVGEANFTLVDYADPDATSHTLAGLAPGVSREFQVAAAVNVVFPTTGVQRSAPSNTAAAATNDGVTSREYWPITLNQPFAYTVTTSSGSARTGWSVTNLPAGLSFDSGTGEITGTPTVGGVFVCPMSADFASGWTSNHDLTLRIIRAPGSPVAGTAFGAQAFLQGDSMVTVPLGDKFSDPDSQSAVRVTTTKGSFDILLYESETPQTFANFMAYMNRGDYTNSIFHRSVPGFVIQGGGFAPSAATAGNIVKLDTDPPVTNEPGISNVTGTVAFAKLGGDPNSATNQFFVNLGNNNSADPNSLDNQNGGFTVFGRVPAAGMATVNAIAALPRANYTLPLEDETGASQGNFTFEGFPVDVAGGIAPATYDPADVVAMTGVAPWPVLSHDATSSDTAVATVAVNGTDLEVTPVGPGVATITVTATDLDGNTVQQTFDVTVNATLATWAAGLGVPPGEDDAGDDIEMDGLTLLEDFAFMGSPTANDRDKLPVADVDDDMGIRTGSIVFRVRKNVPSLLYAVEAHGQLTGMWSTIWESTDGFGAANVSAVDQGDHWLVTVKDTTALTPGNPRFMRVRLSIIAPP